MVVNRLRRLWQYRGFVLGSVGREIRLRYRGSLFGASWLVFTPLVMIAIYTLVFAQIMHSRLPGVSGDYSYSIYLCAGLLQWNLFAEIVQRLQGTFLENANLLKKASFPRLTLPLITVLGAGFNFVVIYGLFLLVLLGLGQLSPVLLVYPAILAVLIWLASAAGLLLAVLNVFFRDIAQITGVVLQLIFWATPIVYPESILPAWLHRFIEYNPLFGLMTASHALHVQGQMYHLSVLAYPAAWALVLSALAAFAYRRLYAEMLDEI